ncbi:hypothetical protein [Evansella tamaricis]|uniref:Uncharacterized protein n=1 Tax=Evansella tamaricis TaxID=2069301 RepID=A0ABS6JGT9_9BACI|nr:hypothetical protein [Evansella tamaricis]MBU9712743.1 hypothetical protein [Evansella tamaricis]
MIHKYLFFIRHGKIRTYHFRGGSFELIPHKGNDYYSSVNASPGVFWDWWKKVSSFINGEDEVDFCFMNDQEYLPDGMRWCVNVGLKKESNSGSNPTTSPLVGQLTEELPPPVHSSWKTEELDMFLEKFSKYSKVIMQESKLHPLLDSDSSQVGSLSDKGYSGDDGFKFGKNIYVFFYPQTKFQNASNGKNDNLETDDETKDSLLSIYYRNKTKSYENLNN